YLPARKEICEKAKLVPGGRARVSLEVDAAPRTVKVPADLAGALAAAKLRSGFDAFSFSHRKEFVDWITSAKRAETRAARIPKVVASPTIQAAAQFMADDVAQHGPPVIPHRSTDGRTARQRMTDAGYPVGEAFTSEIIAWGASGVDGAMRLWLNSPPHRAELNDGRYRAAGLGV